MPPSEFWGLRESEAGFLYVDKALKSYQTLASSHGAQLNFEEKILSLNADGAMGVEIQTNKNRYWVEKLIITAGSWGGPLLQSLNLALPLKVYRVYLSWFACDKKHFLNQGASCFALHLEGDDFYYGFPCLDGKSLKLAAHFAKDLIKKPEDKEVNTPDNYKLEQMQKMIGRHLPHVEQKLLQFSTCLYTNTPDENFIIDTHSQFPQISFALGFSGHGFKFAPVVGEILADLSEKGQSSLAIDFLKLSRFANP